MPAAKIARDVIRSAARVVIAVYLLGLIALFVAQRGMLYPASGAPPPAAFAPMFLTDAAGQYRGLIVDATTDPTAKTSSAPASATVVFFHGNDATASDSIVYAAPFLDRGYRFVVAEYPGYGGRPGERNKASFRSDGLEVLQLVRKRWPGEAIWLAGESLGAGVAAAVAKDAAAAQPPVPLAGVILFTPWSTLGDLVSDMYWFYPVRYLLRDPWDSVENLRALPVPMRVAVAADDEIIPARHGRALCDQVKAQLCIDLPKSRHNDWFGHVTASAWDSLLAPAGPQH